MSKYIVINFHLIFDVIDIIITSIENVLIKIKGHAWSQ